MPYKEKVKQQEASRRHYLANREAVLSRNAKRRGDIKQEINLLKDVPCKDCGEKYPYYVMQFDHINDDKLAGVNWLVRNGRPAEALAEAQKCEVICANCHAERTHQRINNDSKTS